MMRHTIVSPAFFKIFDFLFGLRATLSSAGAPISTSFFFFFFFAQTLVPFIYFAPALVVLASLLHLGFNTLIFVVFILHVWVVG